MNVRNFSTLIVVLALMPLTAASAQLAANDPVPPTSSSQTPPVLSPQPTTPSVPAPPPAPPFTLCFITPVVGAIDQRSFVYDVVFVSDVGTFEWTCTEPTNEVGQCEDQLNSICSTVLPIPDGTGGTAPGVFPGLAEVFNDYVRSLEALIKDLFPESRPRPPVQSPPPAVLSPYEQYLRDVERLADELNGTVPAPVPVPAAPPSPYQQYLRLLEQTLDEMLRNPSVLPSLTPPADVPSGPPTPRMPEETLRERDMLV